MSVQQALEFFSAVPTVRDKLQTLFDVGLGYVRLGQPATTLSGGEAQRIKLSKELSRRATGRTVYLLDEPTTGLHFDDIKKLLVVLNRLVDSGEHRDRHRTQLGCDQDRGLGARPGAGRRRGRRRRDRGGHARGKSPGCAARTPARFSNACLAEKRRAGRKVSAVDSRVWPL